MTSGDQESTLDASRSAIADRKLITGGVTIKAILVDRPQKLRASIAARGMDGCAAHVAFGEGVWSPTP